MKPVNSVWTSFCKTRSFIIETISAWQYKSMLKKCLQVEESTGHFVFVLALVIGLRVNVGLRVVLHISAKGSVLV